jgi:hypothetical protein
MFWPKRHRHGVPSATAYGCCSAQRYGRRRYAAGSADNLATQIKKAGKAPPALSGLHYSITSEIYVLASLML